MVWNQAITIHLDTIPAFYGSNWDVPPQFCFQSEIQPPEWKPTTWPRQSVYAILTFMTQTCCIWLLSVGYSRGLACSTCCLKCPLSYELLLCHECDTAWCNRHTLRWLTCLLGYMSKIVYCVVTFVVSLTSIWHTASPIITACCYASNTVKLVSLQCIRFLYEFSGIFIKIGRNSPAV
jgi:hypothetical protein